MKLYVVAEIEITDRSWVEPYVLNVTKMVERHGGRYLARTNKIEPLEGDGAKPQIMLLLEWPDRASIDAFYDSEEYRPYRESRVRGAKNRFFIVAGEDMARQATIAD